MNPETPATDRRQKLWYLIHSKPRQESVAQENLLRQGYETYLPLTEVRKTRAGRRLTVVEPLFPRYLFIRLDQETDNWSPIRSTVGVATLVRFGPRPTPVPQDLIDTLKANENVKGYHKLPPLRLRRGEKVRIAQGSMMGYEGIFLAQTSQDRVWVLLDILERRSKVSLPVDDIEPAR